MSDKHRQYLNDQIEMHKDLSRVYTEKRYAPDYSRIYQRYWNKKICDMALLSEGDKALDYGCGTGILFPQMLERGCRVTGLDLSYDMLHSYESTTGDVLRVCADGCNAPFADNSFDSIICRGSIHHLPDHHRLHLLHLSLYQVYHQSRPPDFQFQTILVDDSD